MITVTAKPGMTISLGREGENLAREIVFDVSGWQAEYGPGTVSLIARRPGDEAPYPCAVNVDGARVTWPVTAAATARPGDWGECELQYRVGGVVVKSEAWQTFAADALGEPAPEPPEPQKAWVDQVLEAGAKAEQAVINSPKIGDNGNWQVWDNVTGDYSDTGWSAVGVEGPQGGPGADGFSPVIGVSTTETSTLLSIQDASGIRDVEIPNGKNGRDGAPGERGEPGTPGCVQIPLSLDGISWGMDGPQPMSELMASLILSVAEKQLPAYIYDSTLGVTMSAVMLTSQATALASAVYADPAGVLRSAQIIVDFAAMTIRTPVKAVGSSEWETIDEIVLPEAVSSFTVSVDKDGNPFELDEVSILVDYPFSEESRERIDVYYNIDAVSDAWHYFSIMSQQRWVFVIEYSAALGCARHTGYQYGNTLVAARCGFFSEAKGDGLLYHTPANIVRLTGGLAEGTRIVIAGRRSK